MRSLARLCMVISLPMKRAATSGTDMRLSHQCEEYTATNCFSKAPLPQTKAGETALELPLMSTPEYLVHSLAGLGMLHHQDKPTQHS